MYLIREPEMSVILRVYRMLPRLALAKWVPFSDYLDHLGGSISPSLGIQDLNRESPPVDATTTIKIHYR